MNRLCIGNPKYLFFFLNILVFSLPIGQLQAQNELQSLTSQLDTASPQVSIGLYNALCDYYEHRNIDSAFIFAEKALNQSIEIGYEEGIFKSTCNLGYAHKEKGDYPEAFKQLKQALNYAKKIENLKFQAQANSFLGATYQDLADWNTALEYYLTSFRQKEKLNDLVSQAKTANNLSLIYREKKKYDLAQNYILKAIGIHSNLKDTFHLVGNHINLALLYEDQNDLDSALNIYERALKLSKITNSKFDKAILLGNMGNLYSKQGNSKKALELLYQSLQLKQELGNARSLAYAHFHLTKTFRKINKLDSAQSHAKRGMALLNRKSALRYKIQHELAYIYAGKKSFEPAFQEITDYMSRKDSAFNEAKNRQFEQIQVLYETEKKEKKIHQLQNEKELAQIKTTALTIGILLMLVVAILIVNRQQLKIKKNKELAQQQIKLLQTERNLIETEKASYQKQLKQYVANLNQKNELLEELRQEMETLTNSSNIEDEIRMALIGQLIDASLLTERDWDEFKNVFEQVHTNFFARLQEKYPNLTAGEIRLICLLKLDMSTKGIANMQGISVASVRTSKYRLRKKLNLQSEESLEELLEKL